MKGTLPRFENLFTLFQIPKFIILLASNTAFYFEQDRTFYKPAEALENQKHPNLFE